MLHLQGTPSPPPNLPPIPIRAQLWKVMTYTRYSAEAAEPDLPPSSAEVSRFWNALPNVCRCMLIGLVKPAVNSLTQPAAHKQQ